jgi:hypothetical protein
MILLIGSAEIWSATITSISPLCKKGWAINARGSLFAGA